MLQERSDDLCVKQYGRTIAADSVILEKAVLLKDIITGLRDVRNKQQIKPKETIELFIDTANKDLYRGIENILCKQVNAQSISFTASAVPETISCVIGKDKFYIKTAHPINAGNQKQELEKELSHLKGFLLSVDRKLNNEKFVSNAKPEVLAMEQKKKADAETKIRVIEESLGLL